MDCTKIQELMSPYIDGELDPTRARLLEAHTRQCRACAKELEQFAAQDRRLRAVLTRPVPSSPWMAERVIAEAQRRRRPLGRVRGVLRLPALRSALAAVAAIAVVGVSVFAVQSRSVRVVSVQGKPDYALESQAGWRDASIGLRVGQEMHFRTNRAEMLTIRWPDDSEVVLGQNSQASVRPSGGPAQVVLDEGRVYARIRPQQVGFTVQGPQASATVLGTEFWVEAHSGATTLYVIRGRVRFANSKGAVVVTRWRKSTALENRPPSSLQVTSPLDAHSFWWLRHSR
ncbi:MAG: FecR domain-containing protein [Armatimonadota bacterium]